MHVALDLLAVPGSRALGHDDNRAELTGGFARFDRAGDFVVIERDLGNQNDIGAARDTAMQRDPTGVTSHDFHDHNALMTSCGGMKPIERIDDDIDSGIESEGHGRCFEIIVDCFRNADAIDAGLLQLLSCDHRAVAADDDQRFDV